MMNSIRTANDRETSKICHHSAHIAKACNYIMEGMRNG
jgi:hypothetical protein